LTYRRVKMKKNSICSGLTGAALAALVMGFVLAGCASIAVGGTFATVTKAAVDHTNPYDSGTEGRPSEFGASLSLDSYYFELVSTYFPNSEIFREELYLRSPIEVGRMRLYSLVGGGYEFLFKPEFSGSVLVDIGGGAEWRLGKTYAPFVRLEALGEAGFGSQLDLGFNVKLSIGYELDRTLFY
jgi:hypothetical protein